MLSSITRLFVNTHLVITVSFMCCDQLKSCYLCGSVSLLTCPLSIHMQHPLSKKKKKPCLGICDSIFRKLCFIFLLSYSFGQTHQQDILIEEMNCKCTAGRTERGCNRHLFCHRENKIVCRTSGATRTAIYCYKLLFYFF